MATSNEVPPEQILSSMAYQLEAIVQLLEEKKLLTREEIIKRIRLLVEQNPRQQ